jgi:hypothetical protein
VLGIPRPFRGFPAVTLRLHLSEGEGSPGPIRMDRRDFLPPLGFLSEVFRIVDSNTDPCAWGVRTREPLRTVPVDGKRAAHR